MQDHEKHHRATRADPVSLMLWFSGFSIFADVDGSHEAAQRLSTALNGCHGAFRVTTVQVNFPNSNKHAGILVRGVTTS